MPNHNLYHNSGNLIMRGTNEYEYALKEHMKGKDNNLKKELKGLKKTELIKKFHEILDPDHLENVSHETKEEIIERITDFIKEFSGGGKKRKTRKLKGKSKKN